MRTFVSDILRFMRTRIRRTVLIVSGALLLTGFAYSEELFEVSKNLDIFATLFRELNIYYVDEIKPGDLAFFYHSNADPSGIIGTMEIVGEPYPDPT